MKKVILYTIAVTTLLTSCSKYGKHRAKEIIAPDEVTPEEIVPPILERINKVGNLENLDLKLETNSDEAFVSWENSDDINAYITKKMPDGRYDFIKPDLKVIKSGNFLIPKKMQLSGKDILISIEKDKKIIQSNSINFELPSKFEEIYNYPPYLPINSIGNGDKLADLNSLYTGQNSQRKIAGGMSFNEDDTVLYISDKNNHRILIYTNAEAIKCKENFEGLDDLKNACLYLTKNEKLLPFAVLGQNNFYASEFCNSSNGLPQHSCLSSPTDVLYKNGSLYVSDTNNNRVVIFDKAPLYGCHNIKSLLGEQTPIECKPDRVIGKKSLEDRTFSFDIKATLSSPMGLDIFNGDLYIADNGNSRVAIAKGADNPEKWNCNENNFGGEGCSFEAVLGQASADSFDDLWSYWGSAITTDFILGKLKDPNGHLRRLIYAPVDVKVTKEGFVIVASDEDYSDEADVYWEDWDGNLYTYFVGLELYSRVLIFKDLPKDEDGSPTCRNDDFVNNRCDATISIGNDNFNQLFYYNPEYGPSYNSGSGIQRFSSMEIYGESLVITGSISNKIIIYEDYNNITPEKLDPTVEHLNYFNWIPNSDITHAIYSNKRKSLFVLDGNRGVLDEYSIQYKPESSMP